MTLRVKALRQINIFTISECSWIFLMFSTIQKSFGMSLKKPSLNFWTSALKPPNATGFWTSWTADVTVRISQKIYASILNLNSNTPQGYVLSSLHYSLLGNPHGYRKNGHTCGGQNKTKLEVKTEPWLQVLWASSTTDSSTVPPTK